ncbi:MAG: M20/M25/M40 family metallo-hydrolase [Bacteroidota bacterium]
MRRGIAFFFSLIFSIRLFAQVQFDSLSAYQFVSELASIQYEGRKSGTPGGEKAAEWIAGKFQQFGLEPGGVNGTYFQPFKILATDDGDTTLFELLNGRKGQVTYSLGDDYAILTNSGTGTVTTEVVFVGYGINAPQLGYDDYANVDVRGKAVLILSGAPASLDEKLTKEKIRGFKVKLAAEKGAAAVLYYQDDRAIRGGAVPAEYYVPTLPSLWIGARVRNDLFYNLGLDFNTVKSALEQSPMSFPLHKKVFIKTTVHRLPGDTKNVVGIIPGSDPILSRRYVVVGAHMDHTGKDSEGSIYYGADDNASGSGTVMELARAFAASGAKLKRSIAFVTFAAEEQGLLGSKAFVDSGIIPLANIDFMLNLDMVGRGNGNVNVGATECEPELWSVFMQSLPDSLRNKVTLFRAGENSDHYPFENKGIPAFFLASSGSHPDYHQTSDTKEKIQPFVLGAVGNLATRIIELAANTKQFIADSLRYAASLFYRSNALFASADLKATTAAEFKTYVDSLRRQGFEAWLYPIAASRLDSVALEMTQLSNWISSLSDRAILVRSSSDLTQAYHSFRVGIIPVLIHPLPFLSDTTRLQTVAYLGIPVLRIDDRELPGFFSGALITKLGHEQIRNLNKAKVIIELRLHSLQRLPDVISLVKRPVLAMIEPFADDAEIRILSRHLSAGHVLALVPVPRKQFLLFGLPLANEVDPSTLIFTVGSDTIGTEAMEFFLKKGINSNAALKLFGQSLLNVLKNTER